MIVLSQSGAVSAIQHQKNQVEKMVGATLIPPLTRCHCCGKRRTTITGKFSTSGRFTCNGCGRAK